MTDEEWEAISLPIANECWEGFNDEQRERSRRAIGATQKLFYLIFSPKEEHLCVKTAEVIFRWMKALYEVGLKEDKEKEKTT